MSNVVTAVNMYTKGQRVRFGTSPSAPFSIGGVATDPSVVVCKVIDPLGTLTTLTYGVDLALQRSGIGVYYADFTLNTVGEWLYRFEGSGNLIAAAEGVVFVEPSSF